MAKSDGPAATRRGVMLGMASLAAVGAARSPVDASGRWTGVAELPGDRMAFAVTVARDAAGAATATVDIPDSAILRLPLGDVSVDADRIRFALPVDGASIPFAGERSGDTIRGRLRLGDAVAPFVLTRAAPAPSRYAEEPVTIAGAGASLTGALLHPHGPGPHPAIVFQPLARPETRQPWLFWADHFARRGVAALVWDNRGSDGPRGAPWSDFSDIAADAAAAIRLLRARRDIDPRRIGLFTVSQGAWIAPMVAAADPGLAFVALRSAPGLSQQRTVLFEARRELEKRGFSPADVAAAVAVKARFEQMLIAGADDDALDSVREGVRDRPWFRHIGLMPRGHWHRGWWRRNAVRDPARDWGRVRAPVLDLYGERDVELPVTESIAAMAAAYRPGGARTLTTRVFAGADHALCVQRGVRPVLADGVAATLTDWVLAHARPRHPR